MPLQTFNTATYSTVYVIVLYGILSTQILRSVLSNPLGLRGVSRTEEGLRNVRRVGLPASAGSRPLSLVREVRLHHVRLLSDTGEGRRDEPEGMGEDLPPQGQWSGQSIRDNHACSNDRAGQRTIGRILAGW